MRDGGDPKALSAGIYRLVVEQHLDYDVEDGKVPMRAARTRDILLASPPPPLSLTHVHRRIGSS